MRHAAALYAALLLAAAPAVASDVLQDYVDREDETFRYEVVREQKVGGARALLVRLTSQTWRGIAWEHWLSIVVPGEVRHRDAAVLMVGAGMRNDGPPSAASPAAGMLAGMAETLGVPVVVLQGVPNQPLFGGLVEDALIAHTFDRYLETGEEDWPLLLPMVKSVVRAMDAAQAVGREKLGLDLERFVVTGVSKRGWTTWLTGAVDPRVAGMAPTVIDLLNFEPQLRLQLGAYGKLSDALGDYVRRRIPERFDTERGQALLDIIDPYAYRDRLRMPKLILLGTNDVYWTLDAANLYYPGLEGPKAIHYEPNGGHGLGPTAMPTLAAFVEATLRGETLPEVRSTREGATLTVEWDAPGADAVLWWADSPRRDFRNARWRSRALGGGGKVATELEAPATGFRAHFVQVHVPGAIPFEVSTGVTVLPEALPYADVE